MAGGLGASPRSLSLSLFLSLLFLLNLHPLLSPLLARVLARQCNDGSKRVRRTRKAITTHLSPTNDCVVHNNVSVQTSLVHRHA